MWKKDTRPETARGHEGGPEQTHKGRKVGECEHDVRNRSKRLRAERRKTPYMKILKCPKRK